MTTHRIVCVVGAFVVSAGLAQEIVPSNAIRASSLTNHLPAVDVLSGPNWDVRYDANSPDVGIGMRLTLPIGPLRFDYGIRLQDSSRGPTTLSQLISAKTGHADGKKLILRFDFGTPVQTKREATRWSRDVESAERENLRLMNDYRSRAASLVTPHVQPQFHPSAVEDILNRHSR